mgnify:CR=1 FL=1
MSTGRDRNDDPEPLFATRATSDRPRDVAAEVTRVAGARARPLVAGAWRGIRRRAQAAVRDVLGDDFEGFDVADLDLHMSGEIASGIELDRDRRPRERRRGR